MLHVGAQIPGDHLAPDGGGDTARYMTFADLVEVEHQADDRRAAPTGNRPDGLISG